MGADPESRAWRPFEAAVEQRDLAPVAAVRVGVQAEGAEQRAVPDDRLEELEHVLRRDVRAPVEERPRARGALERERGANRRADADRVELPRRAHELDQPALQDWVEVDAADRRLHPVQRLD